MAATSSRSVRSSLISFITFLVLLVVGFRIVGSSAPFWQLLLAAVVAGLIGMAVGQLAVKRSS